MLPFHLLDGCNRGRQREGLPEHGAGIEDVVRRLELLHDVTLADYCR